MVKGVNRQVLDIRETDSAYFERAFFFVRPEYADKNEKELRTAAEAALCRVEAVPQNRRKKRRHIWLFVLSSLSAAISGGFVTALFLH